MPLRAIAPQLSKVVTAHREEGPRGETPHVRRHEIDDLVVRRDDVATALEVDGLHLPYQLRALRRIDGGERLLIEDGIGGVAPVSLVEL